MKLIDFLKVMHKNTYVNLIVTLCGMDFKTRRTADFFICQGQYLNNKDIEMAYMSQGELHIKLKD